LAAIRSAQEGQTVTVAEIEPDYTAYWRIFFGLQYLIKVETHIEELIAKPYNAISM
jgi:hypothetical protein